MALESPVFVGSIDQGTTSSRFLIFDRDGRLVASHQEVQSVFVKDATND
jgi:glycerol kinase